MKIEKKIEIIARTLNNVMTSLKISRDMDSAAAERVNPYDLEEGEREFTATTIAAIYDNAMRTAMIVTSNMIMKCAEEQTFKID